MKSFKLLIGLAIVLVTLTSGFLPAAAQGNAPKQPVTIALVTQTWESLYMDQPVWQGYPDIKKEQTDTLPIHALLRLAITYCMDAYPDLTLKQMISFEPRLESASLRDGKDTLCLKFISMTHKGDIALYIDAVSGELLDSEVNEGGNG